MNAMHTSVSSSIVTPNTGILHFGTKITYEYKQAKVSINIKTITIQLYLDSILFY
jgi:hypothetical protein